MRRSITVQVKDLPLVLRTRQRMHPAWAVGLSVCALLGIILAMLRLIAGLPPTWATVLGALFWVPTAGWLWDDHQRRRFDRMYRDAPVSIEEDR